MTRVSGVQPDVVAALVQVIVKYLLLIMLRRCFTNFALQLHQIYTIIRQVEL